MANPQFVLRSLDAFVLYSIANLPPFAVAGSTGILAAINREQGTSITTAQITIADPTVNVGDTLFNSSVLLTAIDGKGYKGTYTFRFNRTDLASAFTGKELTLTGTYANVYAALSAINTKFGIALEQKDVVNTTIGTAGGQITLTAVSTSAYYNPGSQVVLNASGSAPSLADLASETNLDGFDPS